MYMGTKTLPKETILMQKLSTNILLDAKIPSFCLINLTENLRDEIAAGLEIIKILRNTAKHTSNKKFAAILIAIAEKIEHGHSFTEAISGFPKAFPEYYRALIAAAEHTGDWTTSTKSGTDRPGILDLILSQLKRDEKVRSKVKTAMAYPTFILGFIAVAVLILTFFVLPKMRDFFSALDMEKNLNFASKSLLAVGDFITAYYYSLPFALLGAALGLIFIWRTVGRHAWQMNCFDIYLIGKTLKKLTVAESFALFATLQRAGVSAAESLKIIVKATVNPIVAKGLMKAYEDILAGKNFSESIRDAHWIFRDEPYQVISSAEKTGKLDERPLSYAQSLFNKVEEEIDNLIAIIPSVMLVLVGIVVAFIVIGFYGSFFGAIGQLSSQ